MEAAEGEWMGVQVAYVGVECIHPLSPDKYFISNVTHGYKKVPLSAHFVKLRWIYKSSFKTQNIHTTASLIKMQKTSC